MKIPKKDEVKKDQIEETKEGQDKEPEIPDDQKVKENTESMDSEEHYERLKEATGQIGEDQPLFGDDDLIVNTLELEKRELNEEIGKARKAIVSKQIEIKDKEERVDNIQKSIEIIREKHFPEEKKDSEDNVKEPEAGETGKGTDEQGQD